MISSNVTETNHQLSYFHRKLQLEFHRHKLDFKSLHSGGYSTNGYGTMVLPAFIEMPNNYREKDRPGKTRNKPKVMLQT